MRLLPFLLILACLPARAAPAKQKLSVKEAIEDNEVVERRTCRREKDERLLEVLPTGRGCELEYTKGGITEKKARSVASVELCQKALHRISDRLEQSGFRCE
jgi:hypothetical protein